LFKEVNTINIFDSAQAKENNKDRDNINYHMFDAYTTYPWPIKHGDVFFIDAVHTYDAVVSDFYNCQSISSHNKKYYIFDDYGLYTDQGKGVKKAIDEFISDGKLELVTFVGESKGWNYANGKTLADNEGLICTVI
jgi:hypothetical protein